MKARSYICAYYAYETTDKDGIEKATAKESNSADPTPSFNYSQIQKLQKDFKVHRGAVDFDKAFIFKSIMRIENEK